MVLRFSAGFRYDMQAACCALCGSMDNEAFLWWSGSYGLPTLPASGPFPLRCGLCRGSLPLYGIKLALMCLAGSLACHAQRILVL